MQAIFRYADNLIYFRGRRGRGLVVRATELELTLV